AVVDRIEFGKEHTGPKKLPHVGWTPIERRDVPLFDGVANGEYFYFVHSYAMHCTDDRDIVATAWYGEPFPAAVLLENVFGCQFHPEKSDRAGVTLLRNFCRWGT